MKKQAWLATAILLMGAGLCAAGQGVPAPAPVPATAPQPTAPAQADPMADRAIQVPSTIPGAVAQATAEVGAMPDAVQTLLEFRAEDVKFDVNELVGLLSDRRHEGWVLAAYPDPKTGQPLIGAGFSLDLPARVHPQRDPVNAHPFLEPSSADLWRAAGLEPAKLAGILDEFYARQAAWNKRTFRKHIFTLEPQITDEEANALVRIGIIQAIDNARAYCRHFDQLTANQQMAMAQLVYQMGVNLEEFSSFLTLVNRDDAFAQQQEAAAIADAHYWRDVQLSLVQSQWARLYRARATSVIAMLDPGYEDNPTGAERSIAAILHPARRHRGQGGLRAAAYTRHRGTAAHRRARKARKE